MVRKFSEKKGSTEKAITGYGMTTLPTDYIAAIYPRQSTLYQVENNRDSRELQTTDLIAQALRMGWDMEHIRLYDKDFGVSGQKRIDERESMREVVADIQANITKAVFILDVSRAFRDETGIQYNTYIDVCKRHNALTITPTMVYDFSQGYHVDRFRFEADGAAKFISHHVKEVLHAAKDRAGYAGEYVGGGVPVGYIVDRTDKHNKKLVVYRPHADMVVWLFKRYKELGGRLHALVQEVKAMGVFLPDVEAGVNTSQIQLTKVNGGYTLSKSGITTILTNRFYTGWLSYKGVLVSRTHHEAIIDEETFTYAFKRLSPVDEEGEKQERVHHRPIRYTHTDSPPSHALLKDVIESDSNNSVYVVGTRGSTYTICYNTPYSSTYGTGLTVTELDAIFVDRMLMYLKTMAAMEQYTGHPIYKQMVETLQQKEEDTNSIDKQLENAHKLIARKRARLDLDLDADTLRELAADIKKLSATIKQLEEQQRQVATIQEDVVETLTLLESVGASWHKTRFDRQERFVRLNVEKVVMIDAAPRYVRVEIHWKPHFQEKVDVAYIRRSMGRGTTWSTEEENVLRAMYPSGSRAAILETLPIRSWLSIVAEASGLGLKRKWSRNDSTLDETTSYNDAKLVQELGISAIPEYAYMRYGDKAVLWMSDEHYYPGVHLNPSMEEEANNTETVEASSIPRS